MATQAQATSSYRSPSGVRQGRGDAPPGGGAEAFFGYQQASADVVEGVALATAVATHVLLGALTEGGDDLVRQPDYVEAVYCHCGFGQQ